MTALVTEGGEPNSWDRGLLEIQRYINNSESKVTTRTPFELLHGYRPRFRLGTLRAVSKTVDEWTMPEKLWQEAREQMERSKLKIKSAFDKHRHDNTSYSVGEVVVMKRCPTVTGEFTKLQERYRGPLVVTEKLPGDVYRVVELNENKRSRFATTAHVIQLKSWKLHDQEDDEAEVDEEVDGIVVNQDGEVEVNEVGDGIVANRDEEREVEPKEGMEEVTRRPVRKKCPPVWARDYV